MVNSDYFSVNFGKYFLEALEPKERPNEGRKRQIQKSFNFQEVKYVTTVVALLIHEEADSTGMTAASTQRLEFVSLHRDSERQLNFDTKFEHEEMVLVA